MLKMAQCLVCVEEHILRAPLTGRPRRRAPWSPPSASAQAAVPALPAPALPTDQRCSRCTPFTTDNMSELQNQAAHADNKPNVSYTVFLKVKEWLPGVSHAMQSTTRQYYYCVHHHYAEHKHPFWRSSAHLIVRHSHCQRLHASVHFLHADDAIIDVVSFLRSWK